MISIIQSEPNCSSENLEYILTHDCHCRRSICMFRLLVSTLVVFLLAGVALVAVFYKEDLGYEVMFSIASFCCVAAGVVFISMFFQCRRMVYCPTGSPLAKSILYFDKSDLAALVHLLDTGVWAADSDGEQTPFPRPRPWGNVLLSVKYSCDNRMAFCRLMQSDGFGYVPVGKDHFYTDSDADRVRRFVDDCRRAL